MKKAHIFLLSAGIVGAVLLTGCASRSSEPAASSGQSQQLANPWTESDAQGVLAATGFSLAAPEGAADVAYSYLGEEGLAQMTYTLDGASWIYRVEATEELADISGLNYTWLPGTDGEVSGCAAVYYAYNSATSSGTEQVQLVNWYDTADGTTHSLSASGKDLSNEEMCDYAQSLYAPPPYDADPTDEEAASFLGEHTRPSDESTLSVSEKEDGSFTVNLSITRLCSLEGGVGTYADNALTFTVQDPNEGEMTGVITRAEDNTLSVEITQSTWGLLPPGEVLDGFE